MTLRLVPLSDAQAVRSAYYDLRGTLTLGEFLARYPCALLSPLSDADRAARLASFAPPDFLETVVAGTGLYPSPGMILDDRTKARLTRSGGGRPAAETAGADSSSAADAVALDDASVVRLAYSKEIENVASFLRAGLSVLVTCDKLVADHLSKEIPLKADKTVETLELDREARDSSPMAGSVRSRQIELLRSKLKCLHSNQVLVIAHLDLLAGGNETVLSNETRDVIDILYGETSRLVLAFADRSLGLAEVLADRFSVRIEITGIPPEIEHLGKRVPLGQVLVSGEEAGKFEGYDPREFYKRVVGMNPIRLRQCVTYAVAEKARDGECAKARDLYDAIQAFKAQQSLGFEVPDVSFDHIGGYENVKKELQQALVLMTGKIENIPNEKLQRELIPRGFIFFGPPGTGKTLFAKAIANKINANILVVSGPEVTDKYVGESERKIRELFAEARRNAPAVLVFDEFDLIAASRTGRDDGGSRAGNAIVAQILTEMDGFRPDVPLLVIGTTNRRDIIDEALLRPSRFRAIKIDLPDEQACLAIAKWHSKCFEIPCEPLLPHIAAAAFGSGFNGDEIRSIFKEACRLHYCDGQKIDARILGRIVGNIQKDKKDGQTSGKRPSATPSGDRTWHSI